jgi:predicted ATPase
MLENMSLRNFKSWRDTGPIKLAPITAFFGTNSSGKTSLLQSLLLLRQTTESPDRNRVLDLGGQSSLVDLGTAQDIIFVGSDGNDLEISVSWRRSSPIQVRDLLKQAKKQSSTILNSARMTVATAIKVEGGKLEVENVTYKLGESSFSMSRRDDQKGYELTSSDFEFVRSPGRVWPLPAPARFYGFPDQVRLYYQNAAFLSELEVAFEEACSNIRYLGPLRDDPKRQYVYSGAGHGDVGRRGEFAVDALVSARAAGTRVSRGYGRGESHRRLPGISIEQLIAEWLRELGLIDSFVVDALDERETLYRILVRRSSGSPAVMLTDVGFGVSQVLPVLVLLAIASEGDTVILEQPEIHLHPAVQSGLADIILETALVRNVQIILESHSEHLLSRLQRRIAETKLARNIGVEPDDIALYFCSYDKQSSQIAALKLDDYGNIQNWPTDFFGNPLEDSVAMLQAAATRSNSRQ